VREIMRLRRRLFFSDCCGIGVSVMITLSVAISGASLQDGFNEILILHQFCNGIL
jgi:hypothetical protein